MTHSTDVVDNDVEDYLPDRNERETFLEKRLKLIGIQRWKARKSQSIQADRMSKRSRTKLGNISVGDTVVVPIPDVDRGRCDARNLVGRVISKSNDMFKIGVRAGILNKMYSRNQIEKCSRPLMTEHDINSTVTVSLRGALKSGSSGGQGYIKCGCKGIKKCTTNKCVCFKNKLKCNSRCHNCNTCNNKT